MQQNRLALVVGVAGGGDLVSQEAAAAVPSAVRHHVAGPAGQAQGPHNPGRAVAIAGPAAAGPAPAAVVALGGDELADRRADAAVDRLGLRAGGLAGRADQFLQGQRGHQVAGRTLQARGVIERFDLAPRRRGEQHVEQASFDRWADENLQGGRADRHVLGRFDPHGRVAAGRAAGGDVDRSAEGPHGDVATHDVFLVASRNGQLEGRRDIRIAAHGRFVVCFGIFLGPTQGDFERQLRNALGRVDLLRLSDRLAADGRLERDVDLALLDARVVDRDGHDRVVAVGEGQRQFHFAEQIFLDGQLAGRLAGQCFERDALGQQLPGGRRLRQMEADGRFAVFVGNDRRVPIPGLGHSGLGQQHGALLG